MSLAQPPRFLPRKEGVPTKTLIYRPLGKVVLFVMDGIGYRQAFGQGLSAFGEVGAWLEQKGSAALLNTMGYGGTDHFRSAMTIACGVRAFADETAGLVLEADEPMDADTALNAYRRRVGEVVLPDAPKPFKPLVFPMLSELLWRNKRLQKKPIPFGIVAQSLRQKGIRIVGIGCGDVVKVANGKWRMANSFRQGLLMALDEKGVGIGMVGATGRSPLLRKNSAMPFGIATDERRWQEIVDEAWRIADVLVLFPGDTLRADLYGIERLIPEAVCYELNRLLRPVTERLNFRRDLLLVYSLSPSRLALYEHSFIVAVGKGMEAGGLLTSNTTHQNGLVSVLDIPATVLDFYSVKPLQPINGSPIRSVLFPFPSSHLFGLGEAARITDSWWRYVASLIWCIVQGVAFLAVAGWMALNRPFPPWASRGICWLAALPILMLLLGSTLNFWLQGQNKVWSVLGFGTVSLLTLLGWLSWVSPQRMLLSVVAVTALCLTFDGLTSGRFLSLNTPLGYSSYLGIRNYGFGNAGMGLALGTLLASGILLEQRWLAAALCGFGTVLVGAPFWGANIGGALTGAVLTATVIGAGRWHWWHLLIALILTFALLGAFAAFELLRPEPLTHWGRFLQSVSQEPNLLLAMVWRKMTISLRVFRSFYWDFAFAGMLTLTFLLWLKREQDWSLWALALGSAAALVFNDTGPQTPVTFAFLPLCVLAAKNARV